MTRMPSRCASSTRRPTSATVPHSGATDQVIRDVIAAVAKRRRVEGQQPQAVDPEPGEVVQLFYDAGDVTDTVAIGVVKASRQQLVKDGSFEPVGVAGEARDAGGERAALAERHAGGATRGLGGLGALAGSGFRSSSSGAQGSDHVATSARSMSAPRPASLSTKCS